MRHLLHDERGKAGGDMAGKREQCPRADARCLPVHLRLGVHRAGQIGGRPGNGPSSPVRQLHDNIAWAARGTDGDQQQSLTAERVTLRRHRHMRYQPVNNRGSVRCSVIPPSAMRSWIASFTMLTACSSAANPCARRWHSPSQLDLQPATMETSTQSSGRCATRPTLIGTAGRLGSESVADIISECPADIVGIRNATWRCCRRGTANVVP